MATRKIKNAKDLVTDELIYFKSHAQATFMSDGTTVEDKINNLQAGGADLTEYAKKSELASVATSGNYNDLSNKPTIPSAVTESTVSGWGFTKNAGTVTGVKANGTAITLSSGVANIPAASTSAYGVTKLSSATNSTSTSLAATASAVKAAYDLANGKQAKLVSGTNIKTINGASILGSGDITISGGPSDANIQAVDTGDVIDDVNVEYATKTYVDGLIGDINSVLESIISGCSVAKNITFRLGDIEYEAEEGMTFGQWMLSDYYVLGTFRNDTDYINAIEINPSFESALYSGGEYSSGLRYNPEITTQSVIIANTTYIIDMSGSSN